MMLIKNNEGRKPGRNRIKQILSIMMVIVLLGASSGGNSHLYAYAAENTTQFAGGDGSETNPYRIETAAHLNQVRHYLDSSFILVNDLAFTSAHFNSTAGDEPTGENFYNSGAGWLSIGSQATPFTGTFDGNGHIISGVYAIAPQTYDKRGLFGYSAGNIKDLELRNGTLSFDVSYKYSIGSLVGRNSGTIEDCHVTMDVATQQAITGSLYYGGIASYNEGTILQCSSVSNLKLSQDISQTNISPGAPTSAGGIVGINTGTISNCTTEGNFLVVNAFLHSFGGIASKNDGDIIGCTNKANIVQSNYQVSYFAGIAASNKGTIDGCCNLGNISGYRHTGGVAAYNSGKIQLSNNLGDIISIISISDSTIYEAISGGIAGQNSNIISKCYNTGLIQADGGAYTSTGGQAFAGGIAGYNDGSVFAVYNTGEVRAYTALTKGAGGISGTNRGVLSSCYNIGKTGSTSQDFGPINGYHFSTDITTESDCYYMEGLSSNGYGQMVEGWAMEYDYIFEGFDFENVWTMGGNEEYPMPELAGNQHIGIPKFMIQFNTMGGSTVNALTGTAGQMITAPTNPVKKGYDFVGWYLDGVYTKSWSFDTDAMKYYNFTLYAKWTPQIFSVAFDPLGGSAVEGKTVAYNEIIGEPSAPVRTGYTFNWWRDSAYNVWRLDYKRMDNKDLQLYAVWTVNQYKVTYNPNNETMNPYTTTYEYGAKCNSFSPTRTGYLLAGWFAEPDFITPWDFQTNTVPDHDISLYAKWNPIEYTVEFNGNGGTGTLSAQTHTYNETKQLVTNTFTKDGYTFLGWATSPTGSVVYTNLASVKNLATTNGATVTLYAKWGAPILTAASYSYTSIKVSWSAAYNATGYRIYRATSATGTYSLVYTATAAARSYVNTGLTTGKTYYYKVYPLVGTKAYANTSYKYAKPVPATPNVVVAKYSTTSIKVSWSGVSGATKYQIYRATSANGTYTYLYTASSTARSWVNTGLSSGKTYYYKVRTYHLEGTIKVYGNYSTVKYLKI
jgi:uncharacterized repeat protein (TIGR02543 family)